MLQGARRKTAERSELRSPQRHRKPDAPALLAPLLLIALLALSGCDPTGAGVPASSPSKLSTGTQGLVIRFYPNSPPQSIFEGQPVPVTFSIQDKGAYDVNDSSVALTFSYDAGKFTGTVSRFDLVKFDKQLPPSMVTRGKSYGYPDGQTRTFDLTGVNQIVAKPIAGKRVEDTGEIAASLCYNYKTFFQKEVCVDTNTNGENLRTQGCAQREYTISGGQGAPLAVVSLKEDSLPVSDPLSGEEAVLPAFLLTIKEVGDGHVIAPGIEPVTDACILHKVPADAVNAVRIDALLLDTTLDCVPGPLVRLFEGQAQVRCSVPPGALAQDVYHAKQNFMTTLLVNLSYTYVSSAKADMTIERSTAAAAVSPFGQSHGYYYVGGVLQKDPSGAGVTMCQYYGTHPDEAPGLAKSAINATFSCACSREACQDKILHGGRCYPGMCPGATECCVP